MGVHRRQKRLLNDLFSLIGFHGRTPASRNVVSDSVSKIDQTRLSRDGCWCCHWRSTGTLHRGHEPAPGLPAIGQGRPVVHRTVRIDDQHDRATGPVHGLQPCEALFGLLGTGNAFDEDSGITGAVDHRGGRAGEEPPVLTGQRPADIEPEDGKPPDRVGRDEDQHRHGATEVTGILATNVERHSASIALSPVAGCWSTPPEAEPSHPLFDAASLCALTPQPGESMRSDISLDEMAAELSRLADLSTAVPLPEPEVVALEEVIGTPLPDEFRSFLL